jgi:hypothetical protein
MSCIALVGSIAFTGAAFADDDSTRCVESGAMVPVLQIVNGHRVYVMPHTRICGQRQQPYAFSLTGRTTPDFTRPDEAPPTTNEIVAAVRRAPF